MTTEQASAIAIPALTVSTEPAFTALCFNTPATLATLAQFNEVPGLLYDEAARLGLTVSGPIQYVYDGVNGDELNEFGLTIALPIREPEPSASTPGASTPAVPRPGASTPGTLSEGLSLQTLPAFRCTTYTYAGAWDTFPAMYDALFPAFYQQGHSYTGHVREVYEVVDFEQTDRCITQIQVGL